MDLLLGLAALLFLVPSAICLLLAFSGGRTGPEGPVGAHLATAPLALAQAVALGLLVHAGIWDLFPYSRLVFTIALGGYVVTMTLLPILGAMRGSGRTAARAGLAAVLGAGSALSVAVATGTASDPLRWAAGAVLAVPALVGWTMIAGLLVRHLTRDLRRAREDARRDAEFAARKIVEDAAEWAKLPADAPLSKLIQHTHSLNEGVRRDCRARIAARPALGEEMIRLLGTGWAGHAVDCLRDAWPLPYAPLAAAFGSFLQRELETWRTTLERPGSAASWELNLRGRFEVAAKIVAEGGDLRGPLEAWDALLAGTQGLEGLVRSVRDLLGKTR